MKTILIIKVSHDKNALILHATHIYIEPLGQICVSFIIKTKLIIYNQNN